MRLRLLAAMGLAWPVLLGDARPGLDTFYTLEATGSWNGNDGTLTFTLKDSQGASRTVQTNVSGTFEDRNDFGLVVRHANPADGETPSEAPIWDFFSLAMETFEDPGEPDGVYGELTRQAVFALQGVEGLSRDGVAGPQVRAALDDPVGLAPTVGDGIEIDRDRQVLTVVADGQVRWRLHTSTGHGGQYTHPDGGTRIAATPAGEFTITRQIDGWRDAPLGRLYRPAYFNGGIAIHGYPSVPGYAASSGCARVTLDAMDFLWREGAVATGQRVVVH
jgi:N-acetylmuramoyl-L-alanine amidase